MYKHRVKLSNVESINRIVCLHLAGTSNPEATQNYPFLNVDVRRIYGLDGQEEPIIDDRKPEMWKENSKHTLESDTFRRKSLSIHNFTSFNVENAFLRADTKLYENIFSTHVPCWIGSGYKLHTRYKMDFTKLRK